MKSTRFYPLWLLVALNALVRGTFAEDISPGHDPAVHIGSGLKRELFAGISEADFLRRCEKPKTVKITLVTAFTEANGWMNFNGYSHGQAIYVIPTGWTVDVTFINPSPAPHSAIVVEREMVGRVRVGDPVFKGASTKDPVSGISMTKESFSFTASAPGEYAIACGFPAHATGGHWIAFNVRDESKVATLKLGDAAPKEAK